LAFTTTVGAGGTSLIGTSGVDTTTFAPGTLATAVFIGAQGDNDFVTLQNNQANNYTIRGGAGVDTIITTGGTSGFRNSLVTGDDGNDVISIAGTIQSATVSGLEGTDNIAVANVNAGLVNGNNGNDTINFGTAAASVLSNSAKVVGGQGNDTVNVGANGFNATLTSGIINGQDGDDTISVRTNDMTFGGGATIFGGQGSDVITASGNGNTIISGDLGADNITAANGRDTIFGGDGNDRITAGNGADSVIGGEGLDTIVSGTGTSVASTANSPLGATYAAGDTFTFGTGVDIITDFTAGANGDIFSNGNGVTLATNLLSQGQNTTALAGGTTYMASGNFSNGVFTIAANNSGSDVLIVSGQAPATVNNVQVPFTVATSTGVTIVTGINLTQLVAANFA